MKATTEIFNFTDYRSFLRSYAEEQRQSRPHWSYRGWAHQLGFKSTSALTMILKGQRLPNSESVSRFAQYFNFNDNERDYFQSLVDLSKAKHDSRLSVLLMQKMRELHPKGEFEFLDDATFSSLSKWYYSAIREMTFLESFEPNPEWIQKRLRFKVSISEIKQALDTLLQLKLLERDKNGHLTATQINIKSHEDVANEAIKQLHEAQLDLARQAQRQVAIENRQVSGVTMTVNESDLPEIKNYLRQVQTEFVNKFASDKGDQTTQLNIQFFPLTKPMESKPIESNLSSLKSIRSGVKK